MLKPREGHGRTRIAWVKAERSEEDQHGQHILWRTEMSLVQVTQANKVQLRQAVLGARVSVPPFLACRT